jgi:hypothetical protein
MGGRNTVLLDAVSRRIPLVSDIPTIIFGADVTHPETREDTSPSIAAVRLSVTVLLRQQVSVRFSSNRMLPGCCFSRLARSYKVCWIGVCSTSSARAHPGPVQNMA